MKFTRVDATISTNKLIESKEFYMDHFGFQLVYESDWYIELVGTEIPAGISFTLPQREAGEYFNGKGLILSFEVADVDSEYARLKAEGVDDPNGVHLYIYKSIPATPEYQEIYESFQKKA
ncbi:MAG: Glyoxalase-like domain containing protein [Anaerospora sp.]|nr:Glyoxalase-like domain containing protein [Anaerospora sp.]